MVYTIWEFYNETRHRKRLRLYSVFFPLFTHKRVVKQLSSTHPIFCWLLKSKHSLIRRECHSLTAHRDIHPTPLISFQIPAAYAIYWAVSELLSIFSSWFSKPVSKKRGKISSSVWAFIECYSSPPSECEQGENIFPLMAKELSGRNTLLFLDKTLLASWFCLVHEEFPSFSLFCPNHLPWGN